MDLTSLQPFIKPIVEDMGYELFDLSWVEENQRSILRVTIDQPTGIDVSDCEKVSHAVSDWLDQKDPISQEYFLEVSSPGAERELRNAKDYARFRGFYVHVETFEQTLEGTLDRHDENAVYLNIKGKRIPVSIVDIQLIRLAIRF